MDEVSWGLLTLTLTAVGGLYTWFAFRRRGVAAGLRGAGLTLLPLAAYLTKTLQMFTRIVDAVTDWAAALVFSPTVWIGTSLAGLSVVLLVVSSAISSRRGPPDEKPAAPAGEDQASRRSLRRATKPKPAVSGDDDIDEVEAILRKRGIT